MSATEAQADAAIERLMLAIEAARNSNQAGEDAVVRAANALGEEAELIEALEQIVAFEPIPPMDYLTTAERLETSIDEIKDIASNALERAERKANQERRAA